MRFAFILLDGVRHCALLHANDAALCALADQITASDSSHQAWITCRFAGPSAPMKLLGLGARKGFAFAGLPLIGAAMGGAQFATLDQTRCLN